MSGISDVSFSSGLLNGVMPDFLNAWGVDGEESSVAAEANVATEESGVIKLPAVIHATEEPLADDDIEDDGMDNYLMQIADRQAAEANNMEEQSNQNKVLATDEMEDDGMDQRLMEAVDRHVAEEKNKVQIHTNILVKQVQRGSTQTSKLRSLLKKPRSLTTKNAQKLYANKGGRKIVNEEEDVEEETEKGEEEEPRCKKGKKISEGKKKPTCLYPTALKKKVKQSLLQQSVLPGPSQQSVSPDHSQQSVLPDQAVEEDETEENNIPTWTDDTDFTASQKEAVKNIYKIGNKMVREIGDLDDNIKDLKYKQSLIAKQIEWAEKNRSIKLKKLRLFSSINFIK